MSWIWASPLLGAAAGIVASLGLDWWRGRDQFRIARDLVRTELGANAIALSQVDEGELLREALPGLIRTQDWEACRPQLVRMVGKGYENLWEALNARYAELDGLKLGHESPYTAPLEGRLRGVQEELAKIDL